MAPVSADSGGAAQELGNDLARLLTTFACNLLQAFSVIALDADQDRQFGVRVALVHFDLIWTGMIKLGVKITRLRIGVGPGLLWASHPPSLTATVAAGNYDSGYGEHR